MNNLNQYIQEKLKITSKTKIKINNKEWSILNAEDGDIIYLDNFNAWFIYKGIDHNKKFKGSNNAIIYYVLCYEDPKRNLSIGPTIGIGDNIRSYKMHLASDEERDKFEEVLKNKGYKWDKNKKELIKI